MVSDSQLLHNFITLKCTRKPVKRMGTVNFTEEDPALNVIRHQAIMECRVDLISKLISLDWNDIPDTSNKDIFIKTIVKNYLVASPGDTMVNKCFTEIYNILQSKIVAAPDILYYLNPLKFPGYEASAMGEMLTDPSLDYSGFISACNVKRISDSVILDFIDRIAMKSNSKLAQSPQIK